MEIVYKVCIGFKIWILSQLERMSTVIIRDFFIQTVQILSIFQE